MTVDTICTVFGVPTPMSSTTCLLALAAPVLLEAAARHCKTRALPSHVQGDLARRHAHDVLEDPADLHLHDLPGHLLPDAHLLRDHHADAGQVVCVRVDLNPGHSSNPLRGELEEIVHELERLPGMRVTSA